MSKQKNENSLKDPKSWFILAAGSAILLAFFGFEYWCGDFMSGKFNNAKGNSRDIYEYGAYSWCQSSMKSEMQKDKEYATYALIATGVFLGLGFYFKSKQKEQ